MARISSDYDIAGRYGNLVVYQVGSQLYARTRSSLDGKRFRKDRAFARSRERAKQFGAASRLAKTIYASLPKEVKCKGLFGKLTAYVAKGVREGKTKETLLREVQGHFARVSVVQTPIVTKPAMLRLKIKRPTTLSNWQVTAAGRLQCISTSIRLYQSASYREDVVATIPDG